jgi:hypothetical protein
MERAAIPRSVAMALGGWRSESMYRRYAIAATLISATVFVA